MKRVWSWLKPKLAWLVMGAVLSVVAAVMTFGRSRSRKGKVPPRPKLEDVPDVKVPDVDTEFRTDLHDTVKDDYDREKVRPKTDADSLISRLNDRYK